MCARQSTSSASLVSLNVMHSIPNVLCTMIFPTPLYDINGAQLYRDINDCIMLLKTRPDVLLDDTAYLILFRKILEEIDILDITLPQEKHEKRSMNAICIPF